MKQLIKVDMNKIPIMATIALFLLLFAFGSLRYTGFFTIQVFLNLFIDNAYLIVVATGLCFVILTGGIDLSVGSMIAFISMISATLLEKGISPILTIVVCLVVGTAFGLAQGFLIVNYDLHPWIVTLAGMFLARGLCYIISIQTITITDEIFTKLSQFRIPIPGDNFISISVVVAIIVVITAMIISKYSQFGRNVYAIGGSENSAMLMGIPVKRTKIIVYGLCSFCSALGGLLFTIYMLSGYGLHCLGMEMEAIAACVIGGILLTGGVGMLIGPMFGVLSAGIIQAIVTFEGTLNSWWTKIAVGILLFIFILLQRIIVVYNTRNKKVDKVSIKNSSEAFVLK